MRLNSIITLSIAALAMVVFATSGCDKPATTPNGPEASHDGDSHADHGHDHDHDHPAHGPYGGHIFDLDSSDYQAEWKKYKDNDVIRMYLLDADGKEAKALKVDSFTVKSDVGDDQAMFELAAEDADENGASAVYMLEDKQFASAIPLGVTITIKSGDQTMMGKIKAHAPRDH